MDPIQARALAAQATFDQIKEMVVVLTQAVVAADAFLDGPTEVSGPPSRAKALARAHVEEAMALVRQLA